MPILEIPKRVMGAIVYLIRGKHVEALDYEDPKPISMPKGKLDEALDYLNKLLESKAIEVEGWPSTMTAHKESKKAEIEKIGYAGYLINGMRSRRIPREMPSLFDENQFKDASYDNPT